MVPSWWQRWMKKQFGRASARVPGPRARHRASGCHPRLESLEDRIAPASRLFAVPTGGTQIVELNPANGATINSFLAPDPTGGAEIGLAFDGTSLFFINGGGNDRLYELNPDTGAVLDSDLITAGSHHYDGLAVLAGKVYVQDH